MILVELHVKVVEVRKDEKTLVVVSDCDSFPGCAVRGASPPRVRALDYRLAEPS